MKTQPHSFEKRYRGFRFPAQTIRLAIETYENVTPKVVRDQPNVTMKVTENGEQWSCPTLDLLLLAYPRSSQASYFRTSYFEGCFDAIFSVMVLGDSVTEVRVEAPDRSQIAAVVNIFESNIPETTERDKTAPAGIEYVGIPGVTQECIDGIVRLIQHGDTISRARLLSHANDHCLLLTVNAVDFVGVKSGFGSGYRGEGSRGLSFVLALLDALDVAIDEYEVPADLIGRLDACTLTEGDLAYIERAKPVRPTRWHNYVFGEDVERREGGTLWRDFPPVMPWAIIEPRIIDLALKFFAHPNENLLRGYSRLEDNVRKRTGIDDHSAALFSKAFLSDPPKLAWKGISTAEQKGRGNLFTGAYMAHRNPRAHRELEHDVHAQLAEFLLLNHLYVLEGSAFETPTT